MTQKQKSQFLFLKSHETVSWRYKLVLSQHLGYAVLNQIV